MTNRRNLLILLLVFGALIVVTLLQNRAPASAPVLTPTACQGDGCPTPTPAAVTKIFPDWQLSDVRAVRLQNPQGSQTLTITRAADGSWISPELTAGINQEVANGMAQAAVSLSYTRILEDVESEQWADYGLTTELATLFVQVILMNDEQHYAIIGGVVPTGDSFYALVDERPQVYVVAREGGAADFLLHYFIEVNQ